MWLFFKKEKWTQMFLYFRTCPNKWTRFVSVAAHWAYVHFSVSGMKNHLQFKLSSKAKGAFYVGRKENTNLVKQFFMLILNHDKRKWVLGKKTNFWFLWQVTVMHSMQAGHMDKAQKYTDKALMQIEKLKSKPALFISSTALLNFSLNAFEGKLKLSYSKVLGLMDLLCYAVSVICFIRIRNR